jgi:transposase
MNTERFVIADKVWEKVSPHLPGKSTDCGVTAANNRLFLEAILWRVRTGSPWRDLPLAFGNWNNIFKRFRRWAKKGVFERLFDVLSEEPDFEYVLIGGTIVSVHQKASGAKGGLKIRPSGVREAA